MTAYEFICSNIDSTAKTYDKNFDDGNDIPLIKLPYPFTTPGADKMFREMYYWDTYFTHKYFLVAGKVTQAINNVKNFVFLLENYGKIPNGNRKHYIGRSQPPFFGLMLSDLIEYNANIIPVKQAYKWLEKEYLFWQTKRNCKNGLNRYYCDLTDSEALGNTGYYKEIHTESYEKRTGIHLDCTVENAKCVIAECESGWDFSPRFNSQCIYCNPVDLNCLLYVYELLLSEWAGRTGKAAEYEIYAKRGKERKEKIIRLMKRHGIYYDYNFKDNICSSIISAASFFPYFSGIDADKRSFKKLLAILECDCGIMACKSEKQRFQWSEPNSWAPLNYVAAAAAQRLGLKDEAKRIADKYLLATDKLFEKTGRLWEKYNAKTGDLSVTSEYETPPMFGWTAGVYAAFYQYRGSGYTGLL